MQRAFRTVLLGLCLIAATVAAWSAERDQEKLGQVKSVALLTIYGPEKIFGGFGEFPQQGNLDYVEAALITQLGEKGWQVLPPQETRATVDQEFFGAFSERVRPEHRKLVAKYTPQQLKTMLGNMLALKGALKTPIITSTNTARCIDYYGDALGGQKEGQAPKYSDTFRQAAGAVAEKLGADAAVVVWVEPAIAVVKPPSGNGWGLISAAGLGIDMARGDTAVALLHTEIIGHDGSLLFGEKVLAQSNDGIGVGGMNLNYDGDKLNTLIRQALDAGLADTTSKI